MRIKNILGRIFAVWGAIVFVGTMLLIVIPVGFTYWIPGRKGVEQFRKFGRAWIHSFLFLTGCRIVRRGAENFKKGENYIVIVNHNSLIDIPISTPEIPGPNKTIAKVELSRIPIFGIIYKRGSVLVDRKNAESRRDSYRAMKAVLAEGTHMCIYPEGTRNKTGKPLAPFHDGAFKLSVDTGKHIVPALLFHTKKVLPQHRPFFFWPAKMEMHFLEPVSPEGLDAKALKDKLHEIMEAYYVAHA
ncbi:lysophospholipid acyltransferase family protein [Dinghuibacter silviterrae]|uniref:1-acyl-sn-glycerol-3-phosphate acyltransferase n=1 Tax=Dinghuibacter silviterrae TaxID=1539049 RepID=A0A4R8DHW5_9BACT|nr:lysophospholipid acyltransferase family protein [Dinghuibacter silviterrae]TDW97058.1 1-acyl-sn-glycerol-3-phosphate acyltransferase [Dinghuibacter silviterrae]